ncbi:MAG: SDR family NAD(P)-dependent oxidoreductase [Chloroflexi bacterium]|nr:MAG: SDR family NAD(P)-dependent oxidoreductase [Chloroflexota bacterium]
MTFKDKVVLVTGGGRGIGAATAERFARDGAKVVISDMDLDEAQLVARPIQGLAIACDVTDREQVNGMVARTVGELGRLDVLVCSAGIIRDNLLFKMTDDDWDAVIDTHLKGSFLCARAAQRPMVDQKYGKMVFLSSTSALGNRGQANYSAAKAGLQGMARTLAIELGPFNINVNTVAPGFVETRMTRATAERMGVDFDAFKIGAASQIPLGRITSAAALEQGTPRDGPLHSWGGGAVGARGAGQRGHRPRPLSMQGRVPRHVERPCEPATRASQAAFW